MWPIIIVVVGNVFYHICAKQTPQDVDPFFSLVITYGVAMLSALLLFFLTAHDKSIPHAFSRINWVSYVFGICVVALEFGSLNMYRVGWQVSTASLVANISLAVILLVVGLILYHESLSLRQVVGFVVCAAGLVLISKP